jgi:HSP20 family protein
MAMVKWNPWSEFEALNQSLDHWFNRDISTGNGGNGDHTSWMPHMDVKETDNAYVIEADLPGMTIENIDVQVESNRLFISGERKDEQSSQTGHYTHFERAYGKFQRTFTLPEAVNVDAVEAKYVNGVLTVSVPKSAEAQSKRIAIQST